MFDTVAIIIGIVIGAGIFRLPSLVAANLESDGLILAAWAAGGAISLIGALCFAELIAAFPHAGGEYHFLVRAYGRRCGFMFGWARMTVVQTGSIAMLAFIFGDYAAQIAPLGVHGAAIHAALAVGVLTALNMVGLRQSRTIRNILATATVLGLTAVVACGLLLAPKTAPTAAVIDGAGGAGSFGLAMVFVLLTYGGWNEAAYVAAEMRDVRRKMVRALLLGIGLITLIYIAVNLAYVTVLGAAGMAASQAVAREMMQLVLGPAGEASITVLILLVVLASINGTVITGARTNYAFGRDFPIFGFLAGWHGRANAPIPALLLQAAIALALILLGALDRRGVETAIEYLSPVFWLFFLLVGLSLFVLRRREPHVERPFRVPLYPVTPALFCLTSAGLLWSSLSYTGGGAIGGIAVLALGVPLLIANRYRARRQPDGGRQSGDSHRR